MVLCDKIVFIHYASMFFQTCCTWKEYWKLVKREHFHNPLQKLKKSLLINEANFTHKCKLESIFCTCTKFRQKITGTHFIQFKLQTFLKRLKFLSNQGHVSSICTSKWQMCVLSNKYIKCDKGQMVPINQRFDILLDSLFMIYLSLHSLAIYCSKMSEIALL